ncbi:hypothetical protein BGW42_004717 [Actinomortierella wolfii]|nr:hypothetical protein BGW42_004717 [Actinomortierella wolfii]
MGTVGVNGRVTFRSLDKGCLLYMSERDGVLSYNDAYCLMPIIGSAVVAFFALVFMLFQIMVLRRHDDFNPRAFSKLFIFMCGLLALFSFAMCGEIGIGLNRGCNLIMEDVERQHCRSMRNFAALYAAEISAGIMGGIWILVMLLELLQYKRSKGELSRDAHLNSYGSSGYHAGLTTVRPHSASNTPRPQNAGLANTPEMDYAQSQGYAGSPYLQSQQQYATPDTTHGAGPKTELPETSYHGSKNNYHE